eukprot:12414277-Karenia_brevis.AAC.1
MPCSAALESPAHRPQNHTWYPTYLDRAPLRTPRPAKEVGCAEDGDNEALRIARGPARRVA